MNQKKHILLTGGTGLIGKQLTDELLKKDYTVSHLSRSPGKDTVLHLVGAGIAEKRWTDERKKEIIDSRTKSIGLIYNLIKNKPNGVKSIISASATGYYSDRGDDLLTEDSLPAHDFLGTCCIEWEKAVDEGMSLGLRILKFRTGVVLNKDGGALAKMATLVRLYVGSPLGDGRQWIPWIHWKDVIDMYLYGIENANLNSVYNMAAPNPVTNKQLTKAIAKQLHKPLWAPNVPAFALKLMLGEMATIVLGSTKASSQKIEHAGFEFKYPDISSALHEIYG
jgi:uncharacterized protein (TIGR01777 family)